MRRCTMTVVFGGISILRKIRKKEKKKKDFDRFEKLHLSAIMALVSVQTTPFLRLQCHVHEKDEISTLRPNCFKISEVDTKT